MKIESADDVLYLQVFGCTRIERERAMNHWRGADIPWNCLSDVQDSKLRKDEYTMEYFDKLGYAL